MKANVVILASLGLVTVGCTSDLMGAEDTSTGGPQVSGTSSSDAGPGSYDSTGSSDDDGDTSGSTPGSTSGSTGGEGLTCPDPGEDLCPEDGCADGLKCVGFDADEDGEVDARACVPIPAQPIADFEPCEPAEDCTDPCGAGSACRDLGQSGVSLCHPYCDTDYECADPTQACIACAECEEALCVPSCDPLRPAAEECPPGLDGSCLMRGDTFSCASVEFPPQDPGDACRFAGQCGAGKICAPRDSVSNCADDATNACCAELCDITDEATCTDPDHVCVTLWTPGSVPPGLEHVGFCGNPEADPCSQPGVCPPDDVDTTYDWCSTENEALCSDGSLFGFGDGQRCVGGCWCTTSCSDDTPCPTPTSGTAVPECRVEPNGPGSPTSCLLPCGGDVVCPDGMTCDETFGEPLCIWLNDLPPARCE